MQCKKTRSYETLETIFFSDSNCSKPHLAAFFFDNLGWYGIFLQFDVLRRYWLIGWLIENPEGI